MPKGLNLKGFGRRKSAGNILDFPSPDEQSSGAAPSSTFRVIERPEKKGVTYGAAAGRSVSRSFDSPIHALRGKSENDLSKGSTRQRAAGWPLSTATRGSGGTTNSGSSGFYDSSSASARHSSTSTLPSSVDPDREEDLFAHRASTNSAMYQTVSAAVEDHAAIPAPPSFSSRAARAFSFGNRKNGGRPSPDSKDVPPVPPVHQSNVGSTRLTTSAESFHRERAMTTSSYASTAVPTRPELNLGNDFGGDFSSSMFDSLQKEATPHLAMAGGFHRTVRRSAGVDPRHADNVQESEPMFPPRTLSRNDFSNSSSPTPLLPNRDENTSPYSLDEPHSAGFSSSSALTSPGPSTLDKAQAFLGTSKTSYSQVPDRYTSPGLERQSPESFSSVGFMVGNGKGRAQDYPNRQTHVDDYDPWVKKVELRDPQASTVPSRLAPASSRGNASYGSAGTAGAGAASPGSSAGGSWVGADSFTTTPRAAGRTGIVGKEDSIFDASPSGPASRAIRPAARDENTPKKMTKAQFQALQKRSESSTEHSEEEEEASSDEYDDEDDVERAKKLAAQRRQQEATMSVYRQQMKKVTGGGPTDLPSSGASARPSNDRSASSASGFYFGGISGTPPAETVKGNQTGDDDDVPLGILQAHGFPSANRPPTINESEMHHRRASMAASVMGGGANGGNLPAFARNLPADPYFGAGLVNQSKRESLAMNGTGSVYGMPAGPQMNINMSQQPMGHPGGLVGVIAGEEKARAARRGSPNTSAGNFSTVGNMPMNMPPPQMGRAMSMGNMAPPSVYTLTGIPPMPIMPQMGQMPMTTGMDPAMQQFMQMQMQMMQNMINMQQVQLGQQGQPHMQQPPQQGNDYLTVNRPMSMASQHSYQGAPSAQGRSMTMMNPPQEWNTTHLPGQSRPVSAMPPMGSYAPSMNAAGPGTGYASSIAPSERTNVGMPSRYRPVTQYGDPSGRTQSMTSSHTLQAFTNQQSAPIPGTPFNGTQVQIPKSTIRVVDKPKGSPRIGSSRTPVDDDDDEGWAELKQKREVKKKSRFTFGRSKKESVSQEPPLSELYQNAD